MHESIYAFSIKIILIAIKYILSKLDSIIMNIFIYILQGNFKRYVIVMQGTCYIDKIDELLLLRKKK